MNMTSSFVPHVGKAMRFAVLTTIAIAASAVRGATLTPITPTVDHSKKATCGIKWTFNKNQAIKCFRIYRGVSNDFSEADCVAEVDNTTTRHTDWGADQYQSYFYWVIPFDYDDESNVLKLDLSRYSCNNNRYWGNSDVYLTASVKSLAIGTSLPLYFKVNMGTSGDPLYDHVRPDSVRITRMTDLNGNDADDIAVVLGNRDTAYALHEGEVEGNTYLKSNGSFGYIMPYKPGVLYIRAYYRSATTASPLRIEIKKPTFNLYAPEGNVDIVDNNYRDLYLKCNGKFVDPDVERMVGSSVSIWVPSAFDTEGDPASNADGRLYNNSFGFLNMIYSDETSMYDISYNGMLVKEYQITPVWNPDRKLSFFYMDSNGKSTSSFTVNKEYKFGIKYGDTPLPHKISKYGYSWLTINEQDSLSEHFWMWYFGIWYESGTGKIRATYDTLNSNAQYNQLGGFTCDSAGWVDIQAAVLDRTMTDSIYIKGN